MQPTKYPEINKLLKDYLEKIQTIFGDKLLGFYLTGSLSYDDFNPDRSDIDLLVVLKNSVSRNEIELLKKMHQEIGGIYKKWQKRIECSYVPLSMLQSILPPVEKRPYIGEDIFYPEADYGNEWIINNYLLYKYGIALFGPDFKTLIKAVDIKDVQKACIKDLFKEWEPKISDTKFLQNSHYQSYLVLNLCRILYTVTQNEVSTKKISASWIKSEFPKWKNLIQEAENWHYGAEMQLQKETIEFIKFIVNKIREIKKIDY